MATKNFYEVIGVPETAKADEIKKAYRKLAKRYHPDVNGGDKAKTAKFKELTEAYETLGDEKKREEYDHARKNPFAGRGGAGQAGDVDLGDLFSRFGQQGGQRGGAGGAGGFADIFDMFGGGGGGREQRGRGPLKGQDVRVRLEVELPDAALGAEREIIVEGKHLKVRIPAGVTDGKTIRLAGQGEPGGRGAPAGDMLLEVQERPHAVFKRITPGGADVEVTVPIGVDIAILGGKADVPTLEGTNVSLTIPAGTSSGRRMRLRGKGATTTDSAGKKTRGDLYAVPSIQVPTDLSPKAKELLAEFARAAGKIKQEAE